MDVIDMTDFLKRKQERTILKYFNNEINSENKISLCKIITTYGTLFCCFVIVIYKTIK